MRRLGEVGEALVLDPAAGHQVAGRGGLDELLGQDGALGRQVVDDRLAGERLVADARPSIPRRALPEALGRGVGVGLGRLEALLGRRPRPGPVVGVVGQRSPTRLNASVAGQIALLPKPSASRW